MGADLGVMDTLVLIIDVFVDRDQDVFLEHVFKSYNGRPFKEPGIQGKGQCDRSLRGFSSKCFFRNKAISSLVIKDFSCCLVHQGSRDSIFLSRNYI